MLPVKPCQPLPHKTPIYLVVCLCNHVVPEKIRIRRIVIKGSPGFPQLENLENQLKRP
jgi:hypothetical protein